MPDELNFEERYEDVLQNIEFAIISMFRLHPTLGDANVDKVIEGLVRTYTAETNQRKAPTLNYSELEQLLLSRVRDMCEWRLGRLDDPKKAGIPARVSPEPITIEEIMACLKRIRKSIKYWTKESGRQGYLYFVSQFIA